MQIGDMSSDDPIRGEMIKIEGEGFLRYQVRRNGVAAKSIQNQHIEVLWLPFGKLTLQGNACVTRDNGHIRLAIAHKRKISALPFCKINNRRVNFIQSIHVTGLAIRCQSPCANAKHSDALTMSI